MPVVRIPFPIYVPKFFLQQLRRWHRWLVRKQLEGPGPNLWGDRQVEWSFIAAHMPTGPGLALDFGPGDSYMGLIAVRRNFRVLALDLERPTVPWRHPGVSFIRGNLLRPPFRNECLDLIINCSTVEHVGLRGRFGVQEDRPEGDLEAMAILRDLLKPGCRMLLTIPVGEDHVFSPLHRVYGRQRLPRLLKDYAVRVEEYWVKDGTNRWIAANKEAALSFTPSVGSWDPMDNVYALGCFVLEKRPG